MWIPELGSMMVSYFFTLSGFILAAVYANADGRINHRQFWWARIARIVPVYLLAVSLVWILNPGSYPDAASLLLNFTLMQSWVPGYPMTGNSPGWSLSVEAFFYLLFPALLYFLTRIRLRSAMILAVLLWVFSQAVHLGVLNFAYDGFPSNSHDFAYYFPLLHLNEFVLGIVAALAYRQGRWVIRSVCAAHLALIVSLAILVILAAQHLALSQELGVNISLTDGLLCPVFLLLIFALCGLAKNFSRILGHPLLVRLGEASYALYLLQMPVDMLYRMEIMPFFVNRSTVNFWIYYVILVAVSLLVFRYIEHPLRKMLRTKIA